MQQASSQNFGRSDWQQVIETHLTTKTASPTAQMRPFSAATATLEPGASASDTRSLGFTYAQLLKPCALLARPCLERAEVRRMRRVCMYRVEKSQHGARITSTSNAHRCRKLKRHGSHANLLPRFAVEVVQTPTQCLQLGRSTTQPSHRAEPPSAAAGAAGSRAWPPRAAPR